MKKLFSDKHFTRLLAFCMTLCLALSALSPAVLAAGNDGDDDDCVPAWVVSDDGETASTDGVTLHRYDFPAGYEYSVMPVGPVFSYLNMGDYDYIYTPYTGADDLTFEGSYTLYAETDADPDPAIARAMWFRDYHGITTLFVTDDLRAELDALRDGVGAGCRLTRQESPASSRTMLADLTPASYRKMLETGTEKTLPGTALSGRLDSEVLTFDSTDSVCCVTGAVFVLDDGIFVVDFAALPANCFDADGHISYRAAEIPGVMLNADAERDYRDLQWQFYQKKIVSRPYDEPFDPEKMEKSARIMFWIFFVLIGFLVPVVPLVLGLVIANDKDRGKPKRWYVVSALAGAWILIALIIMIILL